MDDSYSFFAQAESICKEIIIDLRLTNGERSNVYSALWDTGANITCVSPRVVSELNLKAEGDSSLAYSYGRSPSTIHYVDIEFPNLYEIKSKKVVCGGRPYTRTDVVIGMDIITLGDFAVSNFEGKTSFTFRIPSKGSINFNE